MSTLNVIILERFFDEFRRLHEETGQAKLDLFQAFFSRWAPMYDSIRREWVETAARFNVFEALRVGDDELSHSAFLAYLLDPSAKHDQGTRFLLSFLEWLDIPCPLDDVRLKRTRVYREFSIGEEGQLDIVVFIQNSTVIAIENKIWAIEGDDQISRYQTWVEKETKRGAERNSCVIFLTPEGREPATRNLNSPIPVICRSYSELGSWLKGVDKLPRKIEVIRDMYVSLCETIWRRTR